MRNYIFILTIMNLLIFDKGFGQSNQHMPFKMAIVKPDTAVIDESLIFLIDSVEFTFQQRYYNSIQHMEQMLEFSDYPEDMKKEFEQTKREYRNQIDYLKEHEQEILDFRYYELMSSYSTEVYNLYFNEYEPYSTIYEISNPEDLSSSQLADSLKVDYLILFRDVHTNEENGHLIMKMTSNLFSAKENKIVLSQQVEAGSNSYGGMWTCMDTLTCLLINSIRNSVEPNVTEIRERQSKK